MSCNIEEDQFVYIMPVLDNLTVTITAAGISLNIALSKKQIKLKSV